MLLDKIEKGTQGYVHQILMPSLVQRGDLPFSDMMAERFFQFEE